jgi:hypothetical protein
MYYRAIIECGHMGAGKSVDTVRYFRADNPGDLRSVAAGSPRPKGERWEPADVPKPTFFGVVSEHSPMTVKRMDKI